MGSEISGAVSGVTTPGASRLQASQLQQRSTTMQRLHGSRGNHDSASGISTDTLRSSDFSEAITRSESLRVPPEVTLDSGHLALLSPSCRLTVAVLALLAPCRSPVACLSLSCRSPVAPLSLPRRFPVAFLPPSCRYPVASCRFLLFPVAMPIFAWRLPVALLSLSCRSLPLLSCRYFLLPPCRPLVACLSSSCRLPVASLSPPCRLPVAQCGNLSLSCCLPVACLSPACRLPVASLLANRSQRFPCANPENAQVRSTCKPSTLLPSATYIQFCASSVDSISC